MLSKEMHRVFIGKDQLKPAITKFCRAIEKLLDVRDELHDAGFVEEDLEGYIDPCDFTELIRWLAEINNEDPNADAPKSGHQLSVPEAFTDATVGIHRN